MGAQNSHWFIYNLGEKIIEDVYALASPLFRNSPVTRRKLRIELVRDRLYYRRRCECEGLAFVTDTMPKFGKWLDVVVSTGEPPPSLVGSEPYLVGFEPYHEDTTPLFMHTIVQRVVADVEESEQVAQAQVIRSLRTLAFLAYKLEVPYSKEKETASLKKFIEVDHDLEDRDTCFYVPQVELVRQVLKDLLTGFRLRDNAGVVRRDFCPKHGPGAVATGQKAEGKWSWKHHYSSLHQRFPYYEFMYGVSSTLSLPGGSNGVRQYPLMLAEDRKAYESLIREPAPTSKLVLVPKDSRGPRLISTEPLEVQFIQQGISALLMRFLEKESRYRGQINFTDQSVNANLALESSRTGEHATLDLSEASDRVALHIVKMVFDPILVEDLIAARSTGTLLPSWFARAANVPVRWTMKKYAPMGSALCFPVESMLFWAICVVAVYEHANEHTLAALDRAARSVFVYGDDLIVPTATAQTVSDLLEAFGLKVNRDKSYWCGKFRESCGMDAYNGFKISPVRVKCFPPSSIRDGSHALAYCKYASLFWEAGCSSASDYVVNHLRVIYGDIPFVKYEQAYLSVVRDGLQEDPAGYPRFRRDVNDQFCRGGSAYMWVVRPAKRSWKPTSDWHTLRRFFSEPRMVDTTSVTIPRVVKTSRRRVSVRMDWLGQA